MSWSAAASYAGLLAALNADILQEVAAADRYLQLARYVNAWRSSSTCRQIAVCAATALSNATALAAEVMALGGTPPVSPHPKPDPRPVATSIAEHLIDARADVVHFQGRLAFARRLGLPRLQAILRDIVRAKRRHVAHARIIASACRRSDERHRDGC